MPAGQTQWCEPFSLLCFEFLIFRFGVIKVSFIFLPYPPPSTSQCHFVHLHMGKWSEAFPVLERDQFSKPQSEQGTLQFGVGVSLRHSFMALQFCTCVGQNMCWAQGEADASRERAMAHGLAGFCSLQGEFLENVLFLLQQLSLIYTEKRWSS